MVAAFFAACERLADVEAEEVFLLLELLLLFFLPVELAGLRLVRFELLLREEGEAAGLCREAE